MGLLTELREAVELAGKLESIPSSLAGSGSGGGVAGGGAGAPSMSVTFATDVKVIGDAGAVGGGGGSTGVRRIGGNDLLQLIFSEVKRIGGSNSSLLMRAEKG